jgi:hypothetical protein
MTSLPQSLPVFREWPTQHVLNFVYCAMVTPIFEIINYDEILVLYLVNMVYVHIHVLVCLHFQCDGRHSTLFPLVKIL